MHGYPPGRGDASIARQLFFEQGQDPAGWVPEVIGRSWGRCAGWLQPQEWVRPEPLDAIALRERREAQAQLRRLVEPEMDALAEMVSDTGSVVLLADAEGLILDAVGSPEFLRKAERVALQPGVVWSEPGRGTNAIGTALAERRAVSVRGREHYLSANGILSCAAAPIVSPRGELFGVLDVSGHARRLHQHALGMVRMAIQIIEHRLATDAKPGESVLRFHTHPDLVGTHREAVLILDGERIVGANRAALQLLDVERETVLQRSVREWLELPRLAHGGERALFRGRDGRCLHGTLSGQGGVQVPVSAGERRPWPGADVQVDPLLAQATKVLDAGIAVLISGETGVGKEVFARRVHAASRRHNGPFVAVDCAALPETLIESELFGYEGGAFTGARRSGMVGRVREAEGGVLFLDEIGDMPLPLQARLLRVLQEHQVNPLGGGRPVAVDFALICATHRVLADMVHAGNFRADLYYRIQDYTVHLPPLRERAEREALIRELLRAQAGDLQLSADALETLAAYSWPGNLRQLVSVLRTLAALAPPASTIEREQLPAGIRSYAAAACADRPAPGQDLRARTRRDIEQTLAECGGCVSEAARRLGIHRSTLYRRLGGPLTRGRRP